MINDYYETAYDGQFMAAFTNNDEIRDYIENCLNGRHFNPRLFTKDGIFLPQHFTVTFNGQPLNVETIYSVSVGGQ